MSSVTAMPMSTKYYLFNPLTHEREPLDTSDFHEACNLMDAKKPQIWEVHAVKKGKKNAKDGKNTG